MALTLLERVGQGSHGEVWRARWGGQLVAAKLLDGRAALDEQAALAEAEALTGLDDPTFVGLREITQQDGRWALILEWVDGPDLGVTLRTRGPAPSAVAGAVIGTCARALQRAWEQPTARGPLRLLHRDLKPGNLLIGADGRVRIADLGLAARWVRPGHGRVGTLFYAAPERLLGEDGPAGDAYALGCVGYELITGRAFGGCGPHAAAHARKLRAARADLRERSTPTGLAERVLGLLAWDPADRPVHADLCDLRADPRAAAAWSSPSWFQRWTAGLAATLRVGGTCAPV